MQPLYSPFFERSARDPNGPNAKQSSWWPFKSGWRLDHLKALCDGQHRFEPPRDLGELTWCYADKLMPCLLCYIIKPTFKHVLPRSCKHLQGPTIIRHIHQEIQAYLQSHPYTHIIRLDIRSYDASIDRATLWQGCQKHHRDPKLLNYLEQIIHIPIDRRAMIINPSKGIPSSVSPFLAALYLASLDRAFEAKNAFDAR